MPTRMSRMSSMSLSCFDTWGQMSPSPFLFFNLFVLLLLIPVFSVEQTDDTSYGVDKSWPMHHGLISKSYVDDLSTSSSSPSSWNQQHKRYEDFMKGCYQQGNNKHEKRADGLYQRKDDPDPNIDTEGEKYRKNNEEYVNACNEAERDRLEMNLNQPKQMGNYTHSGYAKVHTPSNVFQLLQKFWDQNQRYWWPEFWNDGNTYVNHWEIPTMLLDIGRKDLPNPFTSQEYETIVKSIQDILESWTNQRLVLTSAYGIRLYEEGSILAPHVDRLPLVSSAIINIFQRNVTEPWVLEVIGHDGIAHNLTSELGEMILYESASVIHGRPYPLKGKGALYGSIFVHFEPLYHTMRHAQQVGDHYADATTTKGIDQASKFSFDKILQEQLQKPSQRQQNKVHDKTDTASQSNTAKEVPQKMPFRKVPGYVWPQYNALYDQRFYFEYEENVTPKSSKAVFGRISAHEAASLGELSALKEIVKKDGKPVIFKADHNGWRPIHEGARGGHADIVEYLLEQGANVNERTNNNKGGNPLYWANKNPKKNAKVIALLEKHGGVSMTPINTKLLKQFGDDKKDDEDTNKQEKK
mmetsp:Transcript_8067/g.9372  ORF Transcript_8067/g.9372 Transcript_8067/m.9372 type:complete len:581 (+) Transcript_8067:96-1838(+)